MNTSIDTRSATAPPEGAAVSTSPGSPASPGGDAPSAALVPADEQVVRMGHGAVLKAIEKNMQANSVSVQIPGLGTVRVPGLDSLAWIGGLAALAAVGILEWPVAGAVGLGHLLARQQHLRLLKDFGEALEDA